MLSITTGGTVNNAQTQKVTILQEFFKAFLAQ